MTDKIKITASLLLVVTAATAAVARTATDFFIAAPPEIIGVFDRNTRLDMVDYFRNGFDTPSKNVFEGRSILTREDSASISVKISDNATLDIVMLPGRTDTVVAVVETVLTPVPDSGIRLYRGDTWEPLPEKAVMMPTAADFMPKDAVKTSGDLPPFIFATISYEPEDSRFVFTNTTAGYYTPSDTPASVKAMLPALSYVFDGKKLVRAKERQ